MSDNQTTNAPRGITAIAVSGFKSIYDEQHVEIRPLTILAGANSSGKSSIMQPLLLMKQTLEAQYDPGVFKLDGPNVWFTSPEQFLSINADGNKLVTLQLYVELENAESLSSTYEYSVRESRIDVVETAYRRADKTTSVIKPQMSHREIADHFADADRLRTAVESITTGGDISWYAERERFYLYPSMRFQDRQPALSSSAIYYESFPLPKFSRAISNIIHVPAHRGQPQRSYNLTPVRGPHFEGTFENYFVSLMVLWGPQPELVERLNTLEGYLRQLRITSSWRTDVNGLKIELLMGRTLTSNPDDVVNIADVGFGVSQVLPVLVALLVAEPGQLVYIDQPELHLHPKAQVALASILADAANRGVRVVIETHSALLIQGVQTLVAKGELEPEKVKLHWFSRDDEGRTTIDSRDLDQYGAYGDWPEDFAETQLSADNAYLDAVEQRQLEEMHGGQEPQVSGD